MLPSFFADPANAGLYHLPPGRCAALTGQLAQSGPVLLQADLSACRDLGAALRQLGTACRFPIWYGANLDALHDCLTDPDCLPASAVLLIAGLDALHRADSAACSTLVEVLGSAAAVRGTEGRPLWVLLTTPARGVPRLPDA